MKVDHTATEAAFLEIHDLIAVMNVDRAEAYRLHEQSGFLKGVEAMRAALAADCHSSTARLRINAVAAKVMEEME